MLDTKGPEIRTGKLKDKTLKLERGQVWEVLLDLINAGNQCHHRFECRGR